MSVEKTLLQIIILCQDNPTKQRVQRKLNNAYHKWDQITKVPQIPNLSYFSGDLFSRDGVT